MKITSKKYFVKIILFLLIFLFPIKGYANKSIDFLSLKNSEVNLRQGPSFDHPIRFVYKKKFLPLIILEKSDVWLKTKDFQNNSGWIHISQLSNKKSAINIQHNSIIYKKSTIYSKPVARLGVGRLLLVKKCKIDWCKVSTSNYNGWIFKKFLWGKTN